MPRTLAALMLAVFLCCIPAVGATHAIVSVKNPIDLARTSETITLQADELRRTLAVQDVRRIHVKDTESGKDLLTQAVDNDDDGTFDEYIFQTDLAPSQTKTFELTVGERVIPKREDFKAYGRFVQERRDDFAWENDRIAHRTYGVALETWPQEPLTSSAIDVWTKRVSRLVINDWYMVDDYHHDHGEGADLYSAGKTRGCGGNGVWAGEKLYSSANFRRSHTFANGPIRVMFELEYFAWDAGGAKVSAVDRITLDAGQNFDRFEVHYNPAANARAFAPAIGIRKGPGGQQLTNAAAGTLRSWEEYPHDDGQLGCGVVLAPDQISSFGEDPANFLIVAKLPADKVLTYYAGFGWTKSGQFSGLPDWDRYVAEFSRRLQAPVQVEFKAE